MGISITSNNDKRRRNMSMENSVLRQNSRSHINSNLKASPNIGSSPQPSQKISSQRTVDLETERVPGFETEESPEKQIKANEYNDEKIESTPITVSLKMSPMKGSHHNHRLTKKSDNQFRDQSCPATLVARDLSKSKNIGEKRDFSFSGDKKQQQTYVDGRSIYYDGMIEQQQQQQIPFEWQQASPEKRQPYHPNLLVVGGRKDQEAARAAGMMKIKVLEGQKVSVAQSNSSNQNVQNMIKDMIFSQSPMNNNSKVAPVRASNQRIDQQQPGNGMITGNNGNTSFEDRNKILKKILTQFNVKVHQIEHKKFMNIFGLDIKSIPPSDVIKPQVKSTLSSLAQVGQLAKKRVQRNASNDQSAEKDQRINEIQMNDVKWCKTNETQQRMKDSAVRIFSNDRLNESMIKLSDTVNANDNLNLIDTLGRTSNLLVRNKESTNTLNNKQLQNSLLIGNLGELSNAERETKSLISTAKGSRSICSDVKLQNQEALGDTNDNENDGKDDGKQQESDQIQSGQQIQQERRRSKSNWVGRSSIVSSAGVKRGLNNTTKQGTNFKFMLSDNVSQREEIFFKKFSTYKDFIFKINYTSQVFVTLPQENPCYKICIGRGNNSKLIQNCIKLRWWWQIVDYDTNKLNCNFLWTQCKQNDFFMKQESQLALIADQDSRCQNSIKLVAEENAQNASKEHDISNNQHQGYISRAKVVFHEIKMLIQQGKNKSNTNVPILEGAKSLQASPEKRSSVKTSILKSDQKPSSNGASVSSEKSSSQTKQIVPFPVPADHNSKIFHSEDLSIYQKYMNSQAGQRDYSQQNWDDLSFRLRTLKKPSADGPYKIFEPVNQLIHNHMQFNFHLGNKKALFYNMRQYYQLTQDDVFHYLPLTFHLTKGTSDKEFKHFLKKFREIENQNKHAEDHHSSKKEKKVKNSKNIWIVKPGEITNRGNGIQVCDNLNDIKRILQSGDKHTNGKQKTYIVQKYIDRPFLYNRRKFDIRAYMLVTCINGIIRAYWYQEGYIRTSGREFDLSDVSDVFIHLTNDAIQKDCEEYNKYEPGNKLSYFEFQRYLDIWYPDQKWNIFSQIVPQMKAIATDAVRATFLKIDHERKQNNFEVFGLDFMIDEKFNPLLIEINTNPAIETTCPICTRVIPSMIENAFRIGLDPLFPPPLNWPGQKKHMAPDSLTEHNRFEIIFDENFDGLELRKMYKNQQNCLEGVNDLDEDEEIEDEAVTSKEKDQLEYE